MPEMKISALAGWFGSKVEMAPTIVKWLGPHKSYIEPFCGAMSVLLAKPSCQFEIVNDLHSDIINLAITVQHEQWGPWLYKKLRRCLYSEVAFAYSRRYIDRYKPVAEPEFANEESAWRAYYYFQLVWMGRKGVEGCDTKGRSFSIRYTNSGGNQASRFFAAVQSIPQWRRRLRSVTILCRDGFQLLERLTDEAQRSIYCDPPYLVKSGRYVHDFTKSDHTRLAVVLRKFRQSRVVISYYDHPLLSQLYPANEWLKIDCTRVKRMVRQTTNNNTKNGKANEVLLVNRSFIPTDLVV